MRRPFAPQANGADAAGQLKPRRARADQAFDFDAFATAALFDAEHGLRMVPKIVVDAASTVIRASPRARGREPVGKRRRRTPRPKPADLCGRSHISLGPRPLLHA